jgi:4-amino-4-deoxy-L-arabinose transferase-like glycosyltransferase
VSAETTVPGAPGAPPRPGAALHVLALTGICLVLLFVRLGSRALWDSDEGMHAAVALEMLRSGDWVTPRWNGEVWLDKPALYIASVAASLKAFGPTELAARLPSALFGLMTVFATYLVGRRALGARAGFLGAAVLASSGGFVILSRIVVHDICFTAFFTLGLACYYVGATDERRRLAWFLGAWAATALAVLAKGPLGLVLPGAIGVLHLLVVRRPRVLLGRHLLLGPPLFLAIAAPWYLAAERANPGYLVDFIVRQHIGQVGEESARHVEPAWYYLGVVPLLLLPWSFHLPGALAGARPGRGTRAGEATVFLLAWALVPFLLFSAASSKLPTYVLPVLPPLALLVGTGWDRLLEGGPAARRRWFRIGAWALAALFAVGTIYVRIQPLERPAQRHGVPPDGVALLTALVAVAFTLAAVLLARGRTRSAFAATVAASGVITLGFNLLLAPSIEPYRSAKELSLRLDERLPEGEPIHCFSSVVHLADSALFYTDRGGVVFDYLEDVRVHLAQEERAYCLLFERHLEQARAMGIETFEVDRSGRKVLISNRPE